MILTTTNLNSAMGESDFQIFHKNAKLKSELYSPYKRKRKWDYLSDETRTIPLHEAIKRRNEAHVRDLLRKNVDIHEVLDCAVTALHIAVAENSEGIVASLIKLGANVDAKERRFGMTPLHLACKYSYYEIANLLLENHASVDEVSRHSSTPLHLALENENLDLVCLLLDHGANPEAKKYGKSPLHLAAETKNATIAKIILDRGAKVDCTSNDNSTALHVAIEYRDANMADLLIERGADINRKKLGKSPFALAVEAQCPEVVSLLLRAAHSSSLDEVTSRNITDGLYVALLRQDREMVKLFLTHEVDPNVRKFGKTPLHLACEYQWEDVVRLLVSKGADINHRNKDEVTALFVAAEYKNEDIALFLLNSGASGDIQHQRTGVTLLHMAVANGWFEFTRILLQKKVNIDVASVLRVAPVHIAFDREDRKIITLLLTYGVDINQIKFGRSLLQIAVEWEWMALIHTLLEKKFDINSFTDKGISILYTAIKQHNLQIVELLLSFDADVNLRNLKTNRSPLQCAVGSLWYEVVEMLLIKGAEVNAVSSDNECALSIALARRDERMTRLLLDYGGKEVVKSIKSALQIAAEYRWYGVAQTLLENGELRSNSSYDTPLNYAIKNGDMRMVKMLIENGADLDEGYYIAQAVRNQNMEIVQYLLDQGARFINENDVTVDSEVNVALKNSDCRMVRFLIEKGASVQLRSMGFTPLHLAVRKGLTDICKLLIESGVNVNQVESHRSAALHFAVEANNVRMVELLLRYGASPDVVESMEQNTPLHIAIKKRNIDIIKLLVDAGANLSVYSNRHGNPLNFIAREAEHHPEILDLVLDAEVRSPNFRRNFESLVFAGNGDHKPLSNKIIHHLVKENAKISLDYARRYYMPSHAAKRYQECLEEIERMDKEVIYGNIKFFTLLSKPSKKICFLIRNKNIMAGISASDYKNKFPIYKGFLTKSIEKAKALNKLLTDAKGGLSLVLKFEFVDEIQENIMEFMNRADLHTLAGMYNENRS